MKYDIMKDTFIVPEILKIQMVYVDFHECLYTNVCIS